MAVTVPLRTDIVKVTGKKYLLYVDIGTLDTPVWSVLTGQKDSTINRSAGEIDASDKTTGGWKVTLPGLKEWSIDTEDTAILSNESKDAVEYCFENDIQMHVKVEYLNGDDYDAYTGWASITDLTINLPTEDLATISISLKGSSELVHDIVAPA